MGHFHRRCLLPVALTLIPATAMAAGWTQAEGEQYTKVWARTVSGDRTYGPDGKSAALEADFFDLALNIYVERGLTDDFTLVASATPVGLARYRPKDFDDRLVRDQGQISKTYLGPIGLGLRYALVGEGDVRLALEGRYSVAFPVAHDAIAPEGIETAYRPMVPAHRPELELQLGYAATENVWTSATAGVAVPLATETGDDLVPYALLGAQIGWHGPFGLTPEFHVSSRILLDDARQLELSGQGDTRYLGMGLSLSWWFLPNWGVNLGADGASPVTNNLAAPYLNVGVEHR
jgi:hypothetical protein